MIVHSFTSFVSSTRRGEQTVDVITGCGLELSLVLPRGASLLDIGISGWSVDLTCDLCQTRSMKKGTQ